MLRSCENPLVPPFTGYCATAPQYLDGPLSGAALDDHNPNRFTRRTVETTLQGVDYSKHTPLTGFFTTPTATARGVHFKTDTSKREATVTGIHGNLYHTPMAPKANTTYSNMCSPGYRMCGEACYQNNVPCPSKNSMNSMNSMNKQHALLMAFGKNKSQRI